MLVEKEYILPRYLQRVSVIGCLLVFRSRAMLLQLPVSWCIFYLVQCFLNKGNVNIDWHFMEYQYSLYTACVSINIIYIYLFIYLFIDF